MPDESTNIKQGSMPPQADGALNLLDVMEICSNMCLSQMLAERILEEGADLSEVCDAKLAGEISLLKVSPFGKRLAQIH